MKKNKAYSELWQVSISVRRWLYPSSDVVGSRRSTAHRSLQRNKKNINKWRSHSFLFRVDVVLLRCRASSRPYRRSSHPSTTTWHWHSTGRIEDRACLTSHQGLTPRTDTGVKRLLGSMSAKQSPLDVVPTSLINCLHVEVRSHTSLPCRLVNLPLDHATVRARFQMAQVTPLIVKPDEKGDPADFEPEYAEHDSWTSGTRSYHTARHHLTEFRSIYFWRRHSTEMSRHCWR